MTSRYKIFAILAFAIPLLVYWQMMPPGLTWAHHGADGGDLVTAAYTLGVPHPPGYPTFTLLAWSFTRLPLNDVAWRVNLFSAVSTAAAAGLIYWTVTRLASEEKDTWRIIAGLGAAWSYAFAPLVWSQALIAEVYATSGLWTALTLAMAELVSRRPKQTSKNPDAAIFVLGLIFSLGLGIHLTLIALVPVIIWAVTRRLSSVLRRRMLVSASSFVILGFFAGLLIWFYLPLRAGQGSITWGQPTTIKGFGWLVSGALYRGYLFALPLSALGGRLMAWLQTWTNGVGLTGVGLVVLGVTWLSGRQKSWLAATGASFIVLNLYALGYNTADSVVYLVPAFGLTSVWLGAGIIDLSDRARNWNTAPFAQKRHWLTAAILIIALITPVWMLVRNSTAINLRRDHDAENFGYGVMRDAPSRAILSSTTDRQTFTLWYYQHVKGLRPDVVVVDEGLWEFDWYRAGLQRRHPDLWPSSQLDAQTPVSSNNNRPRCQIRHQAQPEWLDCQTSPTD